MTDLIIFRDLLPPFEVENLDKNFNYLEGKIENIAHVVFG